MRKYIEVSCITALISVSLFLGGCATTQQKMPEGMSPKMGTMDRPAHLSNNGHKLLAAGDVTAAATQFERALTMDDSFVPALSGMALVESQNGNFDTALRYAKSAQKKSVNAAENTMAATSLMEVYYTAKDDDWLDDMEKTWQSLRKENEKPDHATLLMGMAYYDSERFLDASICYRDVIDWQGRDVAKADLLLEKLYKELRAQPGTEAGRDIAGLKQVSRGDLAALLIEELKLPAYLDAHTPKKYSTGFKTPQDFAAESAKSIEEQIPADVKGHAFELDIKTTLGYQIRGLELFADQLFHPGEPVTRANFSLVVEDVLIRIKNEPLLGKAFVGNDSPFPDVPGTHFAFNAMIVCSTRNILSADLDGAFRPNESITGYEALLAIRQLKEEIKRWQVSY